MEDYITKEIDAYGDIIYQNNKGQFHRLDGPAIEYLSGSKVWFVDGKLHRENGPAREWADGGKEWWVNGKRHRQEGPAIEYIKWQSVWYLNDVRFKKSEHNIIVLFSTLEPRRIDINPMVND
jgi:hypothetical protein